MMMKITMICVIMVCCAIGCQNSNVKESEVHVWLYNKLEHRKPFNGENTKFREISYGSYTTKNKGTYLIWEGIYDSRDYDNFFTPFFKPGKPWIQVKCIFSIPLIKTVESNKIPVRKKDVVIHGVFCDPVEPRSFLIMNDGVTYQIIENNIYIFFDGDLKVEEFNYYKVEKDFRYVYKKAERIWVNIWETGYLRMNLIGSIDEQSSHTGKEILEKYDLDLDENGKIIVTLPFID